MDNRNIDVNSDSDIKNALAIMFAGYGTATHYAVKTYIEEEKHGYKNLTESPEGQPTLVFLWSKEEGSLPLAYPLDLAGATEFANGWLKHNNPAGGTPDHDGSYGPAWRVFTDFWGHVGPYRYSICAVQPTYAWFGK